MTPKEYKQMMDYLTRSGIRKQVKFASDIGKPVDKFEVQQIKLFNRFNRDYPNKKADGGRIGFDNGGKTFVEQAKELGISKSAFRKPYAPEIEKRIIELANNDKLGAEAIADKLTEEFEDNFSTSPVGKRIAALRKEGKIKKIPAKERAASIAMRGDLYGQAPGEKYLKVREIRDVDRKRIDKSTGKLKFNIPEKAKFKINFGNTAALQPGVISNIPEKFIGVQYFTTKKAAEKALAERKKLKLVGDDPDPIRKKANKKKYDLIKEVSDNNIEKILAGFKKGEPLEQAHRLSLDQVKKTGQLYNVMNLGLDFDSPELVQINNEAVKPFENKLKQLYAEQNRLYKRVKNLKTIPKELQKQIEFNNKKISTVVDLSGGRVQGLQLDEFTLKPKVYGTNYANVLGFGLYDKPVKQLTKEDRAAIGLIMQGQVDNEKRTAGKTAQKLFANAQLLNDVDKLAVKSPPINQIENNLLKLAGQIDKDCAQAVADGGRIGLQSIGSKSVCITKAKNYMSEQLERGIGTQQNAKTSLIKRILLGSANFIKQNLSPKELLKVENLIGKPALYGAAAFETGLVADDVLRKGQPLNVSAAESLFGSVLNLDADAARAKNLLESNVQLSPAAQEYAQNILDYDKYRKLDLSFPSSLIASKMPGSDRYFKMQEELRNKIENTPETGALDYQSALDEAEGTFKAKPKTINVLGRDVTIDAPDAPDVTPLTNKLAQPAGRRVGPMTAQQDMQIDLSLPTYDRSFTASDDFINQYLKSIGQEPLAPGEGTLLRMQEPNQRGLFGTQEKFAGGGIAKLAGVDSGPPPASGPNSQGLPGLLKRVRNL